MTDSPTERRPVDGEDPAFTRLVRAVARDPEARAQFLTVLDSYRLTAKRRLALLRSFEELGE